MKHRDRKDRRKEQTESSKSSSYDTEKQIWSEPWRPECEHSIIDKNRINKTDSVGTCNVILFCSYVCHSEGPSYNCY